MSTYPALDYVLLGEPELTLRELVDVSEQMRKPAHLRRAMRAGDDAWWPGVEPDFAARLKRLFTTHDPDWQPLWRAAHSRGRRRATRRHQGPGLA
jgi:hypothetical protein